MKNKKILATLASTAGLAAVVAPAMCMTSCGHKSHIVVGEHEAYDGEGLYATLTCPTFVVGTEHLGLRFTTAEVTNPTQGKTTCYSLQYATYTDADGEWIAAWDYTIPTGTATVNVGDKIAFNIIAFCYINTKTLWTEHLTVNFTVLEDPI